MKYPIVLRVYAIINLLAFVILSIQAVILYVQPELGLNVELATIFAALWLLVSSMVWIFGSRQSYSFIYLTAASLFFLSGTFVRAAFSIRDLNIRADGFKPMMIYSIVVLLYALLILSNVFFKPVKKWLTENSYKKFDLAPLVSFALCFIVPWAVLLTVNKMNPSYINIETVYPTPSFNEVVFDLAHQTEFDGLILSRLDQTEEIKLTVCYSDTWNAPLPGGTFDYFRCDTLTFRPIASLPLKGGYPLVRGSLSTINFVAKMPVVKAKRIIIKNISSTVLFGQEFVFSTLHSTDYFNRNLTYRDFTDSNDAGIPYGGTYTSSAIPPETYQQEIDKIKHYPLAVEMRALLIKSFFETMADDSYAGYLFTNRKTIKLKGLNVGMYKEFRNMFDSYGLKSIQAVLSDSGGSLDGALTEVSGLSPYQRDETMPFKHVNPVFIEWIERYCLPNEDDQFLGFTTKEIYETVFRRMIWLLAAAHEFVDDGNFDSEAHEYFIRAVNIDSTFYALSYIGNRYSDRYERGYNPFNKVDEKFRDDMQDTYFPFTENMAIGFWLRRKLDGSDAAIWNLVNRILNTYDNYPFEDK